MIQFSPKAANMLSGKSEAVMEKATFGAGCFWGVESFFREVPGVADAVAGYAGGKVDNPTYKQVCTDTTGHAEVVQVTYDPAKVSYDRLLDVFFANHDPTTLNRQGPITARNTARWFSRTRRNSRPPPKRRRRR